MNEENNVYDINENSPTQYRKIVHKNLKRFLKDKIKLSPEDCFFYVLRDFVDDVIKKMNKDKLEFKSNDQVRKITNQIRDRLLVVLDEFIDQKIIAMGTEIFMRLYRSKRYDMKIMLDLPFSHAIKNLWYIIRITNYIDEFNIGIDEFEKLKHDLYLGYCYKVNYNILQI